ncbi:MULTISPECIES: hypothetical protein [Actinomycetes]|nr:MULTISPECIES: hypothetical protein [Actinomycetes]MCT1446252.1 hypothetical protein [Brevibacterium casei]NYF28577.1 hypothetical protein [Microbacterium sp. JAI119]
MGSNADLPSRRSRRNTPPDGPPVVLPHVIITAAETGALDVTIDGAAFPPPAEGQAWTRGTFGALLDAITEDRTVAVRIEVRESDGTVFTDLIHVRKPTPPRPAETEPSQPRSKHTKAKPAPELVEVTGEGFVPGEDIAVALIVAHTDAAGTGHARALLDASRLAGLLDDGVGEVVLLGRVSGTVRVRRLP